MSDDTRITAVRVTAVPTTDQDRALAFYTERLGLAVRIDQPAEQLGGRWIELVPAGDGWSAAGVALVPAGSSLPAGVDTGIRLATRDAAALHTALGEHGIRTGELLHWAGMPPMFSCYDPDGNRLYISEMAAS